MSPGVDEEDAAFIARVLTDLAAELDADALDLDPVYHSIDLELVEEFHRRSDLPPAESVVEFDYRRHTVSVDGSGAVSVRPIGDEGGN